MTDSGQRQPLNYTLWVKEYEKRGWVKQACKSVPHLWLGPNIGDR